MNQETKNALAFIKQKLEEGEKKSAWPESMEKANLLRRIETLQTEFIWYVDRITINVAKTKHMSDEHKADDDTFKEVILTNGQKRNAIAALLWFKRDIEACISHLEES